MQHNQAVRALANNHNGEIETLPGLVTLVCQRLITDMAISEGEVFSVRPSVAKRLLTMRPPAARPWEGSKEKARHDAALKHMEDKPDAVEEEAMADVQAIIDRSAKGAPVDEDDDLGEF